MGTAFNPKGLANPGKYPTPAPGEAAMAQSAKQLSRWSGLDEPEFNSTSAESQRHSGDAVG